VLNVLLNTELATDRNRVGDVFPVEIMKPVVVRGSVVLQERTPAAGRIVALERPGRVSGTASISLVLTSIGPLSEPIAASGNRVEIETAPLAFSGEATRGQDARRIGVGAGIGAAIGAILGGAEGAARGAAAGAGAGTAATLATRGRDLVLRPETLLEFRTVNEVPLFEVTR
jgi:hypothetical protein